LDIIKKRWDSKLKFALWADRITCKRETGKSPFKLVYSIDVSLAVNLRLPVYNLVQGLTAESGALQGRIDQLVVITRVVTRGGMTSSLSHAMGKTPGVLSSQTTAPVHECKLLELVIALAIRAFYSSFWPIRCKRGRIG